jgi:hypothetical protein
MTTLGDTNASADSGTNTATPQSSVPPLDFGPPPQTSWDKFVIFWRDTIDGCWEFFGMIFSGLAVYAGGSRQVVFAFGLAFLAGGLGEALETQFGAGGPFWMFIGGFLIGLVLPVGIKKI